MQTSTVADNYVVGFKSRRPSSGYERTCSATWKRAPATDCSSLIFRRVRADGGKDISLLIAEIGDEDGSDWDCTDLSQICS